MAMILEDEELATILNALRYWQDHRPADPTLLESLSGFTIPDNAWIDNLIAKISDAYRQEEAK